MHTFGTPACKLCEKERHFLAEGFRSDRFSIINPRGDLFARCLHVPQFQKLSKTFSVSTDDSFEDEKVEPNLWLGSSLDETDLLADLPEE